MSTDVRAAISFFVANPGTGATVGCCPRVKMHFMCKTRHPEGPGVLGTGTVLYFTGTVPQEMGWIESFPVWSDFCHLSARYAA